MVTKFIYIKTGAANTGKVFYLDKDMYTVGADMLEFRESLFSPSARPGKALLWDQSGESDAGSQQGGSLADAAVEGRGRNLLDIFKVNTVAKAMAEIRRRCNNNGEIDGSKIPDFRGINIGDYLDLSSLNDGATNFIWNEEYKNLRIVVSGFNIYKGAGSPENTQNHILFSFRNCVTTRQMNTSNTNTGGYAASSLKAYLDGDFSDGLKQALGGDYLYPVYRLLSTKGSWSWSLNTVFIPTEYEVWGTPVWSEISYGGGFQCQWPIFRETVYKGKKYNGSRHWYWAASPESSSSAHFCIVNSNIHAYNHSASSVGGVAPAFCAR